MRNLWTLRFVAFCGMTSGAWEFDTLAEARSEAARRIREARADGIRPEILWDRSLRRSDTRAWRRSGTGSVPLRWEFPEPDGCVMVPDSAGTLYLDPPASAECDECGMDWIPDELPGRHFRGTCPDCIRDAEEAAELVPDESELSHFLDGAVSGMLFTAGLWDDRGRAPCGPGDSTDPDDYLFPEHARELRDDAAGFLSDPAVMRILRTAPGGFERAGTNFHYARNGHGAGFWDDPNRWGGAEAARYLDDAAQPFGTFEISTGTEEDPEGPAVRWARPADGGSWAPCETPEAEFDPATDSARFDVHN